MCTIARRQLTHLPFWCSENLWIADRLGYNSFFQGGTFAPEIGLESVQGGILFVPNCCRCETTRGSIERTAQFHGQYDGRV